MTYRIRYWLGRICATLGFCRECRSRLFRTRNGQRICPCCGRRYYPL